MKKQVKESKPMTDRERIARFLLIRDGRNDDFYFDNRDSPDADIQAELNHALVGADSIIKMFLTLGYRLPPACRAPAGRPKLELIGDVKIRDCIRRLWIDESDIVDGIRIAQSQLAADQKAIEGVK